MDDPWGSSPWVSSDTTLKHSLSHSHNLTHNPPSPSPANAFLSPPPRALVGGGGGGSPGLSSQSLWADDASFGDWSRGDQGDNNTRNSSDWGAWGDSGLQAPQPSSGRVSPIAWPGSTATSPGLKPVLRSRASSVFRHQSPDPWAGELSLGDRRNTLSTPSPTASPNPQAGASTSAKTGTKPDYFGNVAPTTVATEDISGHTTKADDDNNINNTIPNKDQEDKGVELGPGDHDASLGLPSAPGSPNADADTAMRPGLGIQIHDTQSRHSSISSSIESQNIPERQDSPITSIDEEPKLRSHSLPRTISRKPSGKVHELVGMYDGLTKAIIEDPAAAERPKSSREPRGREQQDEQTSEEADDQADFGDFADAEANGDGDDDDDNNHEVTDADVSFRPTSSSRSDTPKAKLKDSFEPSTGEEDSSSVRAPIPRAPSVPVQQLIEKFGPVKFEVDMSRVDKLFLDLDDRLDKLETLEGGEVPGDRVITDSFASISERKTWYRVSRYGSMRKHDSGDDDNYHRVTWPTSQLHSDTIKIVRRWMEEDSFTGRSTLGGSNRATGFNWDSAAAPVELDKIFAARKQPVAHSRTASIPTQKKDPVHAITAEAAQPSRHSMGAAIRPPPAVTEVKATPIASFGWSSDAVKSPIASPPPPPPALHDRPTNGSKPSSSHSIPAPPKTLKPIEIAAPDDVEEDDDDWGEMISSPPPDAQLVIPKVLEAPVPAPPAVPTRNNDALPKLSVAIPQSDGPPGKPPASADVQSGRTDPWPLADFSFLERSARTPKSTTRQDPWPLADFSIFESPKTRSRPELVSSVTTKAILVSKSRSIDDTPSPPPQGGEATKAHVRASTVPSIPTSPMPNTPMKAVLGPLGKPSEQKQQDEDQIVRSIIDNLPDLSYMLRSTS
ncbi:hypothetical protein F4810DRAFT_149323 [Camillea tinctor]|nr:hypothetical protein F4810DRAFT_149323 [Camillea tinctor]